MKKVLRHLPLCLISAFALTADLSLLPAGKILPGGVLVSAVTAGAALLLCLLLSCAAEGKKAGRGGALCALIMAAVRTVSGVFAGGNVVRVYDLVDWVSRDSEIAGRSAAEYLKNRPAATECIFVREGAGVGGIVPQRIRTEGSGKIRFMFRPKERIRDARVCIYRNGERTAGIPKRILTPGEMCSFDVEREKLSGASDILVCVEKGDR